MVVFERQRKRDLSGEAREEESNKVLKVELEGQKGKFERIWGWVFTSIDVGLILDSLLSVPPPSLSLSLDNGWNFKAFTRITKTAMPFSCLLPQRLGHEITVLTH